MEVVEGLHAAPPVARLPGLALETKELLDMGKVRWEGGRVAARPVTNPQAVLVSEEDARGPMHLSCGVTP